MRSKESPLEPSRALVESWRRDEMCDVRLFRELLARAGQECWIAVLRSVPIAAGQPTCFSQEGCQAEQPIKFEVALVNPSLHRADIVQRWRGGPREWSSADTAMKFVTEAMQESSQTLDVHMV